MSEETDGVTLTPLAHPLERAVLIVFTESPDNIIKVEEYYIGEYTGFDGGYGR